MGFTVRYISIKHLGVIFEQKDASHCSSLIAIDHCVIAL